MLVAKENRAKWEMYSMSEVNKRTVEELKDRINENAVIQASVQVCVDALKEEGRQQEEAIDIVGDIFKEFESELRKWLNEN